MRNYDTRVRIGAMQIERLDGPTTTDDSTQAGNGSGDAGTDPAGTTGTAASGPGFGALATLASGALAARRLADRLGTNSE
jgi:hypothetical protein